MTTSTVSEKNNITQNLGGSAEYRKQERSMTNRTRHQAVTHSEKQKMVTVYNKIQVAAAMRKLDERDPKARLLQELLQTPDAKKLATVKSEVLVGIEMLKNKFPNFLQLTNDIKELLELEFSGEAKIIKIPPMLICGAPGIGKTRYLNELAKAMSVGEVKQIDMASASAGFVLGGNSTKWKDGSQGYITTHLQESLYANPIIVLDEVDKAANNSQYAPLGSLYSLLEKYTAKKFVDEALELPMNCSHIIYFATANSLETIPEPIKSRFDIYQVEMPNHEQMRKVVTSVYFELLEGNDWGRSFNAALSEAVITILKAHSPRDLYKSLWKACAKALQRDKCFIGEKSRLIDLLPLDLEQDQIDEQATIGFY